MEEKSKFDIYRPDSALILPPVVITPYSDNLPSVKTPAVVILRINADGCVEYKGKTLSIIAVIGQIKNSIPAFEVDALGAIDKILELDMSALDDCFVFSRDANILSEVKRREPLITAGYICEDLSNILSARDRTISSGCKIIIVPQTISKQDVEYLSKRCLTVWQAVDTLKPAIFASVAKGVHGIIISDAELCIECIESIKKPTFSRLPIMIAHRGCSSLEAENSMASLKKAIELNAEIVECDYYMTTDGVPVIMHDRYLTGDNFSGISGKVNIEDCSYAQIKEWRSKIDPTQGVPTLEEFIRECKGKDILHFIELKSEKREAIYALKKLIDKYDAYNQVNVIVFGKTDGMKKQLDLLRELLPQISLGYLTCDDFDIGFRRIASRFNASYNPYVTMAKPFFVRQLHDRGITVWAWEYHTAQDFISGLQRGIYGITTNFPQWGAEMVTQFTAKDCCVGSDANSAVNVFATAVYRNKKTEKVKAELIPLDVVDLRCVNGKYYATDSCGFYAYLTKEFVLKIENETFVYNVISLPIYVKTLK